MRINRHIIGLVLLIGMAFAGSASAYSTVGYYDQYGYYYPPQPSVGNYATSVDVLTSDTNYRDFRTPPLRTPPTNPLYINSLQAETQRPSYYYDYSSQSYPYGYSQSGYQGQIPYAQTQYPAGSGYTTSYNSHSSVSYQQHQQPAHHYQPKQAVTYKSEPRVYTFADRLSTGCKRIFSDVQKVVVTIFN